MITIEYRDDKWIANFTTEDYNHEEWSESLEKVLRKISIYADEITEEAKNNY